MTSAAEHEAVLRSAEWLASEGHPVAVLPPGPGGALSPEHVEAAVSATTGLVSAMLVNNEVGTVSPVREIAERAHTAGALVHTDAVQAAGLLSLDVDALGVDLLSLSGHKVGGPKGVGVLFVRAGTPFSPLVLGGAQERGRRGGTENVAAIVGMGEALTLAEAEREDHAARLQTLRDRLAAALRQRLGERVLFNTPLAGFGEAEAEVAPHVLSVSVRPGDSGPVDGEMLLLSLDLEGVHASAGSACTSGALEPSHVLQALGLPRQIAGATVRFSLGRGSSGADVDRAAEAMVRVLSRMG